MKLDNRDLVLRGLLVVLPTHLEPYVRALLGDRCPPARLNSLLAGSSSTDSSSHGRPSRGATPVVPDLADLSTQIRILTFRGSDGRYLMPLPPGLGSKLHEVRRFRNDAVHGRPFDADRTLAALVAASEALRLAGADAGRDELRALIAAIDGGHVTGALLDVFRTEPLPDGHAFWRHPRITLTPHTSARTLARDSVEQIVGKVAALSRGEAVSGRVDLQCGY